MKEIAERDFRYPHRRLPVGEVRGGIAEKAFRYQAFALCWQVVNGNLLPLFHPYRPRMGYRKLGMLNEAGESIWADRVSILRAILPGMWYTLHVRVGVPQTP